MLWCVAELLDLPFLVLVFRQWIRADANDAADIDAVLEAERAARGEESDDESRDTPWWLSDPAMQERLRRQRLNAHSPLSVRVSGCVATAAAVGIGP